MITLDPSRRGDDSGGIKDAQNGIEKDSGGLLPFQHFFCHFPHFLCHSREGGNYNDPHKMEQLSEERIIPK
jgi:hypothetical protein